MLSLQVLGFLTGKQERRAWGGGGGQVTADTAEWEDPGGQAMLCSHQGAAEMMPLGSGAGGCGQ